MFDFSKLGDISKMADQAKQIQEKQEGFQLKQLELLNKILSRLEEITVLLKNNK